MGLVAGLVFASLAGRAVATPGPWQRAADMPVARAGATQTTLGDGRILVAGGLGDVPLASAALFDPVAGSWTIAASMTTPRTAHAAASLPDGRVLVAGGTLHGSPIATAEIYDPAANTWILTAPLNVARGSHQLTTLSDGTVLVTGGLSIRQCPSDFADQRVERFDPATNRFTLIGTLVGTFANHSAVLLRSGKVVLYGGRPWEETQGRYGPTSPEVFDPVTRRSTVGTFRPFSSGVGATMSLLPDGRLLVVGGCCAQLSMPNIDGSRDEELTADVAAIYDPTTDTWMPTRPMIVPRAWHSATTLDDGRILIAGGRSIHPGTYAAAIRTESRVEITEIFDPETGVWSAAGRLLTPRDGHIAAAVPDGAIVAGGTGLGSNSILGTVERLHAGREYATDTAAYPPGSTLPTLGPTAPEPRSTGRWQSAGDLWAARSRGGAVLLPSGQVFVSGGDEIGGASGSEIFDPAANTWRPAAPMLTDRHDHTLTVLPDGRVMATGGTAGQYPTDAVEVYDPSTDRWRSVAPMLRARSGHNTVALADGRIMVVGGNTRPNSWCYKLTASAEFYDAERDRWTVAPAATMPRGHDQTVTLDDGRILFPGSYWSPVTEIFDPATNTWQLTRPSLQGMGRYGYTANLLPDGTVLVVGGCCVGANGIPLAPFAPEIFDPKSASWRLAAPMREVRIDHVATSLPDGRILVAGGSSFKQVLNTEDHDLPTEIYDPGTGSWADGPTGFRPRSRASALRLEGGRILVFGGIVESAINPGWQRTAATDLFRSSSA